MMDVKQLLRGIEDAYFGWEKIDHWMMSSRTWNLLLTETMFPPKYHIEEIDDRCRLLGLPVKESDDGNTYAVKVTGDRVKVG